MKTRILVTALVLLAGTSAVWWFSQTESEEEFAKKVKLLRRSARGTADDPIARERWEIERLKDPSTGRIPAGIRARELAFAGKLPRREDVVRQSLLKGEAVQVLSWSKRGPHNVGGRTRALAADVGNPNTLLAGGVSGGVWRSTDDGATWVKTTGSSDIHSVTAIVQDRRFGKRNTWYYGTGEGIGNSASKSGFFFNGSGLFKSTDGGVSWTALSSTVGSSVNGPIDSFFDVTYNLAVDTSNSAEDEIYAATILGIQRSANGGTSWVTELGSFANQGPYFTDVAVTPAGIVYAALSAQALDGSFNAVDRGIWRSTDGQTWTLISNGVSGFPTSYSRVVIGLAPSNPNVAYFLIEGANGTDGVNQINGHQLWKYTYVTGDGSGANGTWVNKGASLPNESGVSGNAVFDTQNGYDMLVQVRPDNENFVLIGSTNLYRTTDFSQTTPTWTRIGGYAGPSNYAQYAGHHPDLHSGFFRADNYNVYYSGHDGGISKTTDVTAGSVTWTFLNNGYVTTQFYTIAIDRATSGNSVIIGGMQDNGTWFSNTTSATADWVDLLSGDGAFCAIADGRSAYYVSAQNGLLYRFILDANGNLLDYGNASPSGGSGYLFINPFVLDPTDTDIMYLAVGDRVWRNSDLSGIPMGGSQSPTSVNWAALTNTVMPQSGSGEVVTALGVSKGGTSHRLYIGSNAASVYRVDNAHTGTPTMSDITGGTFPTTGYVGCVAVNPNNADEVIAVFTNYNVASLWHTANGGTSWTNIEGNLAGSNGPSCRWAAIVPTQSGTTYLVATSVGVWSTTTLNGASTVWASEGGTIIGNVPVDMIDFRTSDGLIVAATHGNGVFSSNIVTSTPQERPTLPVSHALAQNYPNPFNPTTTIAYEVPVQARVTIAVYDIGGREIAVLVDRVMGPGSYSVDWDAKDRHGRGVSSGVYFYTMRSNPIGGGEAFVKTEKMTFVK